MHAVDARLGTSLQLCILFIFVRHELYRHFLQNSNQSFLWIIQLCIIVHVCSGASRGFLVKLEDDVV